MVGLQLQLLGELANYDRLRMLGETNLAWLAFQLNQLLREAVDTASC